MKRLRGSGLDVFLVLLAGVEVLAVLTGPGPNKPAAAALSALSALVFLGRRWQPLAASITAFAAVTLSVAVMPHSTIAQFFGTLATFALTGAVNREREAVVGWLAGAGMLAYASWGDPFGGGGGDFALSLAFGTVMWGAGVLVSRRTRHAAAADLRAELAERDRLEQARHAVEEERARIARELHDIVSHGLSVVVLQTLAARAALQDGGNDDEVDRHLDAVEGTARDALGEMRRMLGLLQVGDLEPAATPSPGLRSLPALVDRATAAGLRVTAADLPVDAELPSGLELAVYRVVQESLTNAVKHAPGSAVTLAVHLDDDAAVVTVVNDAGTTRPHAPEGAGQGLIGMRQRAELYGGSLRTGPTPGGGFAVTATFPLDDVPAAAVPHR
ncbi:MAG: sensor histidine kinase [Blastococcus sp.]